LKGFGQTNGEQAWLGLPGFLSFVVRSIVGANSFKLTLSEAQLQLEGYAFNNYISAISMY